MTLDTLIIVTVQMLGMASIAVAFLWAVPWLFIKAVDLWVLAYGCKYEFRFYLLHRKAIVRAIGKDEYLKPKWEQWQESVAKRRGA